jgi:diguanylate cyclase (GGDEF)-like protein
MLYLNLGILILLTPLEILFIPLRNLVFLRGLVFLTGLTIFLYILEKKLLSKRLLEKEDSCRRLKDEYDKASQENIRLKTDNAALNSLLDETIALYELIRDIRKLIDEEQMFNLFRERIKKYMHAGDCLFLKSGEDLKQLKNYTIFPLVIEKETVGHLAVSDIEGKDRDKFYILAQQFIAGLKGALLFKRLQEITATDSLTQIFNRRYFLERFKDEFERSKKFKLRLSFLMVDIDHFKDFNDRYGHLVGDAILREVTKTIKESIRQIDFMGRYGGEELSIVLTETDNLQARFGAERIRQIIEQRQFRIYDEDLKVTISIGISTFADDAEDPLIIIEKADHALYRAKQEGRNRVESG